MAEQKEEKTETEDNLGITDTNPNESVNGEEFSTQDLNEIEAAYKLSSLEAILNQIQNLVLKTQKDEIVNSDDNKQQDAMDKIDRISEILAGKQGEETGKYVILKTK